MAEPKQTGQTIIYRMLYDNDTVVGEGAYRGSFSRTSELHRSHSDDSNHPALWDDLLELDEYPTDNEKEASMLEFVCGCDSLAKLEEWFDGFYADLLLDGFTVVKFKVSYSILGKSEKQSFFKKEWVLTKEVVECELFGISINCKTLG